MHHADLFFLFPTELSNSGSSQNLSTEESDYDGILESDDEAISESSNLELENSKSENKVQICPHCNETCKGHLKQHVIVCKIYYR